MQSLEYIAWYLGLALQFGILLRYDRRSAFWRWICFSFVASLTFVGIDRIYPQWYRIAWECKWPLQMVLFAAAGREAWKRGA